MKVLVGFPGGNRVAAVVKKNGEVEGVGQLPTDSLSHLKRGQPVSVGGYKITPQGLACSFGDYFDPNF